MVLVRSKDYIVTAVYSIKAKAIIDGVEFGREECRNSPYEALELARLWDTSNIELSLSRTISFSEGQNGYSSDQGPIEESITLGQLEKFASQGENLPKKKFYVPITLEKAILVQAAVEFVTGKPAEWRMV